jgi:hypothetical protein
LIPEGSTLPVVSVGGTGFSGPLPLEQEVGYSVRRSNASGFRDKEIIDTPFSVAVWSWGLALTLWFGIATLAGLLVVGLLSIWPSRFITLLLSSVVLAMSLTLIGFEL